MYLYSLVMNNNDARERAAEILNKSFRGNTIPLPVPLDYICRENNIEVWTLPMKILDGLSSFEGGYCIFLNSRNYLPRFGFSQAHEMGHCFCGHVTAGYEFDARLKYISDCVANTFAASIMIPRSLRRLRPWTATSLAETCGVSLSAARIQLEKWSKIA